MLLRDTLHGCARDHGLVGELRVRIEIHDDGVPGAVGSAYGDAFDRCVGRSIARSRYRNYRGRAIEVPFAIVPPPQTAL